MKTERISLEDEYKNIVSKLQIDFDEDEVKTALWIFLQIAHKDNIESDDTGRNIFRSGQHAQKLLLSILKQSFRSTSKDAPILIL